MNNAWSPAGPRAGGDEDEEGSVRVLLGRQETALDVRLYYRMLPAWCHAYAQYEGTYI